MNSQPQIQSFICTIFPFFQAAHKNSICPTFSPRHGIVSFSDFSPYLVKQHFMCSLGNPLKVVYLYILHKLILLNYLFLIYMYLICLLSVTNICPLHGLSFNKFCIFLHYCLEVLVYFSYLHQQSYLEFTFAYGARQS